MVEYTLMISEKPNAAHKIAMALADKGSIDEIKINKTRYYTFRREKKNYMVIPAVGHLFTLKHITGKKWTYPVFDNHWIPVFEANKLATYTIQYYNNFLEFGKDAKEVIVCTDWDNEGSVIAYNILRFLIKRKKAQRMFFTTLTKEELNESFEKRSPKMNRGIVNAGLTRHRLDWMYGVNLTRALTLSLKSARGGFKLLSTGRVQGPTLKILYDKEVEISKFKPEDYYQLKIIWNKNFEAIYEKQRLFDISFAKKIIRQCKKEKKGKITNIKLSTAIVKPPVPFNLTSLQTSAYNQFKYTPVLTQQIAQKLYTHALISYPRTSSQKLPDKIGFKKIIKRLGKQSFYKKICDKLLSEKKLVPNEGKKNDQAHTSIYPTGDVPSKISTQEKNLYDLIVRRFFSVFGKEGKKENKKISINVKDNLFISHGSTILEKGWMEFYGKYANNNELIFPEFKVGEMVSINDFLDELKQTQPPSRYSHARIVNEMDKRDIGTKSTRANIVKTLNDRGYINGESITVTKLGMGVVKALLEHCPRILSEDLTNKFELQLERIINNTETKEEVINEAQDILIDICSEFKENEEKIGKKLSAALEASWKENTNVGKKVGKCKNCGKDLVIMYSKKNGQEFIGCSNYPNCDTTYSLPKSVYEFAEEMCKKCGAPIVFIGKKKFETCIDRNCSSRVLGSCPDCGSNLRIMFSRRGSRFIGCSGYPKCKKLYGLSSKGKIRFTKQVCKKCKSPIILLNGEKVCINKECGKKNG